MTDRPAAASGTFTLGPDLTVTRLGFGAMRITGPGIWGPPADHDEAIRVLRRAVDLGVDLIDTADSYGPYISEDLIAEALYPYDGVAIATKAGLVRTGPNEWWPVGRPEYLTQQIEMSLRRLRTDTIDLFQLHRIDPDVPLADQLGALRKAQEAGKIRHIGLSEVSVAELREAREIVDIVSVQNRYNLVDRRAEDLLNYSTEHGIGFIPWAPLDAGPRTLTGVSETAGRHDVTVSQLALAWLLRHSPVMLPIPGTGSVDHLEENLAAAEITLTDAEYDQLTALR